ncbi:MAG TPA: DUF4349 domain-containing protein [Solirubrobacterales bacterium]|jgi:hypothetical protein|nr:DUF4349 domain-containing protein [Solirubrobacterales bacterium]
MERFSDHNDLAAALAEVRPAPRDDFSQELDRRADAGFPRRSRLAGSPLAGFAAWIRDLPPRRLLFAGSATALAAIAVATVVIASNGSTPQRVPIALDRPIPTEASGVDRLAHAQTGGVQYSEVVPQVATSGSSGRGRASNSAAAPSSATESDVEYTQSKPFMAESLANLSRNREIERSAEISLLANPIDVSEDSTKVFAAVHDANGIVLHSTTSSGKGGGARFELLIPSARLGDALAAFSSIDEVRSRHEATDDITKPTVTASEELRETQARVDSLLAQLSSAEVESEREAITAELHAERGQAARLRNQLARLHQRVTYSRVLVRIQSGTSTESEGAWGIGNAFHDAGHILGIAAGVTLVGLAVIAPLALLCLLAWLGQRLWLRSRRERALDA